MQTGRMLKALKSFWAFIGVNKEQVQIVGIAIAAIWSLALYYDANDVDKKKESLKYIRQFQKGDVLTSWVAINEFWLTKAGLELLQSSDCRVIRQRATDVVHKLKIEKQVFTVHNYFEDVASCNKNNVCDKKTLCEFFAKRINDYNMLYEDFWGEIGRAFHEDLLRTTKQFVNSCSTS